MRCGSPLARRTPVPTLRRTITALYADLAGFTALVDRLDLADIRAVQRDYFQAVSEVVRDGGGTVAKYVGDAVAAVFGTGRPDPYHAVHAVRAALDVQDLLAGRRFGPGIAVRGRVGVATGEGVVDPSAGTEQWAFVSGTVTTAARVQAGTETGTVTVTAATRLATAALVRYRSLPQVAGTSSRVWRAEEFVRQELTWPASGTAPTGQPAALR